MENKKKLNILLFWPSLISLLIFVMEFKYPHAFMENTELFFKVIYYITTIIFILGISINIILGFLMYFKDDYALVWLSQLFVFIAFTGIFVNLLFFSVTFKGAVTIKYSIIAVILFFSLVIDMLSQIRISSKNAKAEVKQLFKNPTKEELKEILERERLEELAEIEQERIWLQEEREERRQRRKEIKELRKQEKLDKKSQNSKKEERDVNEETTSEESLEESVVEEKENIEAKEDKVLEKPEKTKKSKNKAENEQELEDKTEETEGKIEETKEEIKVDEIKRTSESEENKVDDKIENTTQTDNAPELVEVTTKKSKTNSKKKTKNK